MHSDTIPMIQYAFVMGLVSAASLPIGAFIGMKYQFTDRVIAFLMAFGAGSLLAALTLDLVAVSLQEGWYLALAFGWVIGGALFIQLNNIVNDLGGFRRKLSTQIAQSRRREQQRFRRFVRGIQQLDLFDELPPGEYDALRASVQQQTYKQGSFLFRESDPMEDLFIIVDGSVETIDPQGHKQVFAKRDALGEYGFLLGARSLHDAIASSDCNVVKLPRDAVLALLPNSPTLIQMLSVWLQSEKVKAHILSSYKLDETAFNQWLSAAGKSLFAKGQLPSLFKLDNHASQFIDFAQHTDNLPLFSGLPESELAEIAARLIYKKREAGHTFYYKNQISERLYIVDQGHVNFLDPKDMTRSVLKAKDNSVFGYLSFVTGVPHSLNAISGSSIGLWQLTREDFVELLQELPEFAHKVRDMIASDTVSEYLIERQHLTSANAGIWKRRAINAIQAQDQLPKASALRHDLSEHKGAPLSIWLGIALDGIPEALVIGASLVSSKLSLSLIAGLFISNFPEALSSSAGMKEEGYSKFRILWLWMSLAVITGILAAFGNVYFTNAPPVLFAIIEGIAAGAMLTMIAQTMLPEAYIRGGPIVGVATLLGFLSIILLKGFSSAVH